MIDLECPICKAKFSRRLAYYKVAQSKGLNSYCDKKCAGIGRRDGKTIEQKKKEKAEYDRKYRKEYSEEIKAEKAAKFKIDYAANPEKYREERKRRYPKHLEYLNTPKYKAWKKEYDLKHLAKKDYGVFWEAAILLKELETFLLTIRPDGIKFQMGITNKTQKRKRLWQRTKKNLQRQT